MTCMPSIRRNLYICLIGMMALFSTHVFADEGKDFSALSLYSLCEPKSGQQPADVENADLICKTYLMGMTDGMFIVHATQLQGETTCAPSDAPISVEQARKIFGDYMKIHPEAAQYAAGIVASMALIRAYPCAQ